MLVTGALTSWEPLTPAHLGDFEELLGERGGCAGCWCMLWRLTPEAWRRGQSGENRTAMRHLVASGVVPGILLYASEEPVGWCSIGRRSDFPRLRRSRVLRPLDRVDVWSITCLFVARTVRRRGLSVALLNAACEFVATRGGGVVEGYPVVPTSRGLADPFAWTGLPSAFIAAGFTLAGQPSHARKIMRRTVAALPGIRGDSGA